MRGEYNIKDAEAGEKPVFVTEVNWKLLLFIVVMTLVFIGFYVWWMPPFDMNPLPRPLIPA